MLTSKQRAYLRGLGNELNSVFQIGKAGLSEEIVEQLDSVLEARELIKVKVLRSSSEDPKKLAEEIAEALSCYVVQIIGRVFLLYREPLKEAKIHLP